MVVVADQKTPKDWYSPKVHFLSVEIQNDLGYSVLKHVPYNSYTRSHHNTALLDGGVFDEIKNISGGLFPPSFDGKEK